MLRCQDSLLNYATINCGDAFYEFPVKMQNLYIKNVFSRGVLIFAGFTYFICFIIFLFFKLLSTAPLYYKLKYCIRIKLPKYFKATVVGNEFVWHHLAHPKKKFLSKMFLHLPKKTTNFSNEKIFHTRLKNQFLI